MYGLLELGSAVKLPCTLTLTPSVKIVAHTIGKTLREVSRISLSEVKMLIRRVRSI